jgi:hypothetical protein
MDLEKVLDQLREELQNLDAAIASLEQLRHTGRRRGRPPAWLTSVPKLGRVKKRKPSKPRRPSDPKPE